MPIHRQGLCLAIRPRRGPYFFVTPSFLLFIAVVAISGLCIALVTWAYELYHGADYPMPGTPEIAWASGLYLLGVVTHEMGHVLAYKICGLGWAGVRLHHGVAVFAQTIPNKAQQTLVSACGPFAHLLFGALVLMLSQGSALTTVTGAAIMLEGAANMFLPIGKNSDAAKLQKNALACLRGRGNEPVV